MSTSLGHLQAHHLIPQSSNEPDPFAETTNQASLGDSKNPKKEAKHPFHVRKIPIPDAEYMDEVPKHLQNQEIPGFPTTVAIIGKPGGGKTNLCINLLMEPIFWNGFFDKIYLLGATVKMDKLFKNINIPDSQKVTEPEDFIPKLVEWVTEQKEAVENDPKSAPKCLFFFEDITAYRHTVQNNPEFVKCFTMIRHHKSTAIVNFHKYTALERTARINCMHICVFPVNKTDLEQIYKEYGTAHLDLDDFSIMCRYAWKGDEKNQKPFLYINMYQPDEKRFRKCFTDIIDTSHFEGLGKFVKQKRLMKFEKMMGWTRDSSGRRSKKDKEKKYGEDGKEKDPDAWMEDNHILASLNTSLRKSMGDMTAPPSEEAIKAQTKKGWENQDGPFTSYRSSVTGNLFMYSK